MHFPRLNCWYPQCLMHPLPPPSPPPPPPLWWPCHHWPHIHAPCLDALAWGQKSVQFLIASIVALVHIVKLEIVGYLRWCVACPCTFARSAINQLLQPKGLGRTVLCGCLCPPFSILRNGLWAWRWRLNCQRLEYFLFSVDHLSFKFYSPSRPPDWNKCLLLHNFLGKLVNQAQS